MYTLLQKYYFDTFKTFVCFAIFDGERPPNTHLSLRYIQFLSSDWTREPSVRGLALLVRLIECETLSSERTVGGDAAFKTAQGRRRIHWPSFGFSSLHPSLPPSLPLVWHHPGPRCVGWEKSSAGLPEEVFSFNPTTALNSALTFLWLLRLIACFIGPGRTKECVSSRIFIVS